MSSAHKAGILVVRRQSGYKDIPGVQYHFPKADYLKDVVGLVDCLVLLYEPRRGGTSTSSGGRSAFTGFAFIDRVWEDPDDPTHAYLSYRYYTEFVRVVPLSLTSVSGKSLQRAVRPVDYRGAEAVVQHGLFVEAPVGRAREGLTDLEVLSTVGHGRAEVDAAHIRPVEEGGPDSTRNGLALMKSFHWAFDRGLISLSDEGRILTVERGIDEPVLRMLPADRSAFLPSRPEQEPHPAFLQWHRTNVFKRSAQFTKVAR